MTGSPIEQLAFSAGMSAFLYGLPLVETMRTAAQMTAVPAPQDNGRAPLNQFGHAARPWIHSDRDVVTPANDLLYSMAWLDLADEPVVLSVPAESQRYWVMALLDAYTNNFVNIGARMTGGRATRYAITAPGWQGDLPDGMVQLASPTPLVWVLGRTLVDDADDLRAARALQLRFTLAPLSGATRPARAYSRYQPPSATPALTFFDNLARGLADNPPPLCDRGLVDSFSRAGIRAGMPVNDSVLDAAQQRGLCAGHAAGIDYVEATTRSRRASPWAINTRVGRFGTDYIVRAATAAKGLGGLAADEALYAVADYDASHQPLTGAHRYLLSFTPDSLPPCDAFWSVSLYGDDRFFVANPISRHAIGDRTRGLERGADGSLQILIQHQPPVHGQANWLPAPVGRFYLILRIYHPREAAQAGRYQIPPVTRLAG